LTYGLREPVDEEIKPIHAQSKVISISFTRADLDRYINQKTKGLTARSVNWVKHIMKIIFDVTRGNLTLDTLDKLSTAFLENYKSERSQAKCFIYTRNFLKWLYKVKMNQQILPLIATFEQPKLRKPKCLTTRIITADDIRVLLDYIIQDKRLTEEYRRNFICQIMFLSYTGQRPFTMARIDRAQLVQALDQCPPVLTIKAEQDKIRLEHYVPIHPRLIPMLQDLLDCDNGSRLFRYESLYRYLRINRIPLSKAEGHIRCMDLRKFFEQKSDEVGFDDANKNFIMTHGVSSINWKSYKQFRPESVYKRYMDYWGSVDL